MRRFTYACLLTLFVISIAQAVDPRPTLGIEAVRNPIEGRYVWCFAVYANVTPESALTVTLAYGGSATQTADYTAPTSIILPAGLATDQAIFIPITAVTDVDGDETIICTIQDSSEFDISPSLASASATIMPALADSEIAAMGEPGIIAVSPSGTWSYDLHVSRPRQIPVTDVESTYLVEVEAIDGIPLPSFTLTVAKPSPGSADSVTFPISGTPGSGDGGKQYRFRLRIKIDVDGDQSFVEPGGPTTNGRTSQDIFSEQDIVLAVRLGGTS